jgi:hypothetical protein
MYFRRKTSAGRAYLLAAAVTGVGGLNLAYVCDPKSAVKLLFSVGSQFPFPIFSSGSLAAGTLLCVASPALCAVIALQPLISVSNQATMQLDTAPVQLVDGSSTVAPKQAYAAIVAEHDALKWELDLTKQSLAEAREVLRELKATVLARQKA